MVPSDILGRGLVKIKGTIYEYQTAYPCKWEDVNRYIKATCTNLNNVIKTKAKKIAVLPDHVRYEDIYHKIKDIKNIPIFLVLREKIRCGISNTKTQIKI